MMKNKLNFHRMKNIHMIKNIHFQLWSGMMILVVLVLLLLWLFQVVFLQSFYTSMHLADIRKEGLSILELWNHNKEEQFQKELDAFAFKNNLTIELLSTTEQSLYVTGQTGSEGQIPMAKSNARNEAIREVLKGQTVSLTLTHPRYGNKFTLLGLPAYQNGVLAGALMINLSLVPVEETASILKKQLFVITFILLAAALLISFLISRKFTKPILEIKKVSEAMASGDFSSRIKTEKQDEIGTLAATINHLGQQLAKIEQLRKELIANVSHELRTPLSLIQGYAETLRDVSGHIPEKREKQLGIIIEETQRLSKIVDDILNLSQLQAGYSHLQKTRFPLDEALRTVVTRFAVLSEKTEISIILENIGPEIIEADKERMEQVLYNLINNAFHHSPPGGVIRLRTFVKPETVRVEVSDSGTGIPKEDLPYIWDRYYKADKSNKNVGGTGLGLAIVKGILDAHQAAYGVESTEGLGTTFWFEL